MNLAESRKAIERLPKEEQAILAAWLEARGQLRAKFRRGVEQAEHNELLDRRGGPRGYPELLLPPSG